MNKLHCDVCERHVLITWAAWNEQRVCSGCLAHMVREAERSLTTERLDEWWTDLIDRMTRHQRGDVS